MQPLLGRHCRAVITQSTFCTRETYFSVFAPPQNGMSFVFALCHNGCVADSARVVPVLEPVSLVTEGVVIKVDPDRRVVRVEAVGGDGKWQVDVVDADHEEWRAVLRPS